MAVLGTGPACACTGDGVGFGFQKLLPSREPEGLTLPPTSPPSEDDIESFGVSRTVIPFVAGISAWPSFLGNGSSGVAVTRQDCG
jgi:hypothetical protein